MVLVWKHCTWFLVAFADFDDLVNVLFLQRSADNDEILLEAVSNYSSTERVELNRPTYLFLERIAELNNCLFLHQPFGHPRLALLPDRLLDGGDLLEARR